MGEWLLTLKQGTLSTAEYAICFHMLSAGSSWNEPALKIANYQGFNEELITKMHAKMIKLPLTP